MKERSRIGTVKLDSNNDTGIPNKVKEDKLLIEKLNKIIKEKNNEIKLLQNKLLDSKDMVHDIIQEKNSLKKRMNQYELDEFNLQIGKFAELKNDYNKIEHRLNITKKQLDTARNQIIFDKQVIEDLKNRSLMDYLRKRFPESFVSYKKQ